MGAFALLILLVAVGAVGAVLLHNTKSVKPRSKQLQAIYGRVA